MVISAYNNKDIKGFTLIELSIVLVVIGLVIGGILVGKALIRSAEINAAVTDAEKIKTAIYAFKNKYDEFPGDMSKATSIWGNVGDCTVAETSTATCDGDGDGFIEGNPAPSPTSGSESFLMWKHLTNAALFPGNYIGIPDGTNYYSVTSRNAPPGRISNSMYYISYFRYNSGAWTFNGTWNHTMTFGKYLANDLPHAPIVSPAEAQALDSKYDDGKPGTGKIRVRYDMPLCTVKADGFTPATGTDTETALYISPSTTVERCALLFPTLF